MRHGTAADHVLALTAILHDGSEHLIRRGRHRFDRRKLALPTGRILETDPGALGLSGQADLLDLLLGSQGTLGAITSLRLALSPAPAHVWGLVFFLGAEEMAAGLVESLAEDPPAAMVSLDFLDWASLQAVKGLRRSASKLADIPEPPLSAKAAVLVELNAPEEGPVEEASGKALASCQLSGGDPDESWALVGPELEKMRTFRHAVPEAIGGLLDLARAGGFPAVKLATDHSRPGLGFGRCLAEYRRDLREAGLEAVIFGHARDNLLHVNFLPRDRDEARRARELCGHFLGLARAAGGELFLEHGVGKIKRDLFLAHERPERIRALREVREALDPDGLLNPGNIFPAGPGQGGPGD
jgi:D-lactate dehydrogenase (cytochrome)